MGTEDVAKRWADYAVRTHEDGYIKFTFKHSDLDKLGKKYPYEGGPGFEWEVPHENIDLFNRLTVNKEWIDMPW